MCIFSFQFSLNELVYKSKLKSLFVFNTIQLKPDTIP